MQLDEAVNLDVDTIVIEPTKVGTRTVTWLTLGKYLRRFSTTMGVCCLLSGIKLNKNFIISFNGNIELTIITGSLNLVFGTFYFISWNSDPCIKYKYEENLKKLSIKVPRDQIRTSKPIILVKNSYYNLTNFMHYSVFSLSLTYLTYRCFKLLLNSSE